MQNFEAVLALSMLQGKNTDDRRLMMAMPIAMHLTFSIQKKIQKKWRKEAMPPVDERTWKLLD